MNDEAPPPPEAERERWLPRAASRRGPAHEDLAAVEHAAVWSRLGRCDHAWAWLDRVDPDGPMYSRAEEHRGRVLRELGLHDAAEAVEQQVLRDATDMIDVVALRLSLAADAVGRGEPEQARSRLDGASALLDEMPDQPAVARQRLRRTWVRVEVTAAEGRTPSTNGLPTMSDEGVVTHPPEAVHGSDFHRAKGLLFAAAVRHDPRMLEAAAAIAPPMLDWAIHLSRHAAGDASAAADAHDAWARIVPPPGLEEQVRATPTATRLASLGPEC